MNVRLIGLLVCAAVVAVTANHNCEGYAHYCQNGGICHDGSGSGGGWTEPTCICPSPYTGQSCEITIRQCRDNPCQNGATCVPGSCSGAQPSSSFASQRGECFQCKCTNGWGASPFYRAGDGSGGPWNFGGLCDWPLNDCTTGQKCFNGGTCTSINLADGTSTWSCTCPVGWRGDSFKATTNCTVADCTVGGCQNGGTCNTLTGVCACPVGYGREPNCAGTPACDSSPCPAGNTCTNTNTGSGYVCTAPSYCSQVTCMNGGTCNEGLRTCLCPSLGNFDGQFCNVTKFCVNNPCQNGATCNPSGATGGVGGLGSCTCVTPWAGDKCDYMPNGCAVTGCANGGTCPCKDQASCLSSKYDNKCQCLLPSTASSNVGKLRSLNADCGCATNVTYQCPLSLSNGASSGSITYASSWDNVCQHGGACVEWAGGTGCICQEGFWGAQCENYDNPCLNAPCQNGGACTILSSQATDYPSSNSWERYWALPLTDRFWSYNCACKYPYFGRNCENVWNVRTTNEEACAGNPCQNGGTCKKNSYLGNGGFQTADSKLYWSDGNVYKCTCPAGYYGDNCENRKVDCTTGNNPCDSVGGVCVQDSSRRGASCVCKCGYAGLNCEIRAVNYDSTTYNIGSNLLDFCAASPPCQNGATCVNTLDRRGFKCQCAVGWAGWYCDTRIRSAASALAAPSAVLVVALAAIAALFH